MKTQEAIDFFGGIKELATALDMWPHAIYKWREYPPKSKQYEIQVKSGGKLKVSAGNL